MRYIELVDKEKAVEIAEMYTMSRKPVLITLVAQHNTASAIAEDIRTLPSYAHRKEGAEVIRFDVSDGRVAEIEATGKGRYVLPLAIALSDEFPHIAFGTCHEIAERMWVRLEWPDIIEEK